MQSEKHERPKDPESNPVVFIPDNARINVENQATDPPVTKYEKRKFIFQRDSVRKLAGGKYGRTGNAITPSDDQ